MILYTTQISQWRKVAKLGIEFYDVTVKSGDKLFAPSWKLLMDFKNGLINEETYTRRYYDEMRQSYVQNKQHWLDFIDKGEVCIACYCKCEGFCHRYLLVEMLCELCKSKGVSFNYEGEIK